MQFEYNSDHPAVDKVTGAARIAATSAPLDFPPAQPVTCARITTRIFHPQRNQVATVQNVLVKTQGGVAGGAQEDVSWSDDDDDDIMSSSSSSSEPLQQDSNVDEIGGDGGDDDDVMKDLSHSGTTNATATGATAVTAAATTTVQTSALPLENLPFDEMDNNRAYWIQRTIREAIYGRVWMAIVLKRREPSLAANDNAEWEVTNQFCAIKEMSWQHIRKERSRLAEDPIKEVSAMQYLKRWQYTQRHSIGRGIGQPSFLVNSTSSSAAISSSASPIHLQQQHHQSSSLSSAIDGVEESFRVILETNIMMPLDLLTDDRHLYSIMPYCNGGELFERLDMNERFSEPEARYWMYQVLNVSRTDAQSKAKRGNAPMSFA